MEEIYAHVERGIVLKRRRPFVSEKESVEVAQEKAARGLGIV